MFCSVYVSSWFTLFFVFVNVVLVLVVFIQLKEKVIMPPKPSLKTFVDLYLISFSELEIPQSSQSVIVLCLLQKRQSKLKYEFVTTLDETWKEIAWIHFFMLDAKRGSKKLLSHLMLQLTWCIDVISPPSWRYSAQLCMHGAHDELLSYFHFTSTWGALP